MIALEMKKRPTVHVRTREEWRAWLQANHGTVTEIWLVFDKRHTGQAAVAYGDAVEEALCFGWVDSLITRLDDARYARKFTPRKVDSKWSTINKQRYARMQAQGLLAEAGLQRPPTARSGDAPPRPATLKEYPAYITKAIKANRAAWAIFEQMAPSHRWQYVMWIDEAKRPETREKRLREAIERIALGHKPGLK
jgi:uncharacterized protein YdeI (YjbR/CyaY-like superfamily)